MAAAATMSEFNNLKFVHQGLPIWPIKQNSYKKLACFVAVQPMTNRKNWFQQGQELFFLVDQGFAKISGMTYFHSGHCFILCY